MLNNVILILLAQRTSAAGAVVELLPVATSCTAALDRCAGHARVGRVVEALAILATAGATPGDKTAGQWSAGLGGFVAAEPRAEEMAEHGERAGDETDAALGNGKDDNETHVV